MLDHITPIILTYNEAPNIGRVLSRLTWAREVVVADSFSDDEPLEIVRRFKNTRLVQRAFDSHSRQWAFAVTETDISTPWVLPLDADYIVSDALLDEITQLPSDTEMTAYRAAIGYRVFGKTLRTSIYPPTTVLLHPGRSRFIQDGHTEKLHSTGAIGMLRNPVFHDDRKSIARFMNSQASYMELEKSRLLTSRPADRNRADRIRRRRYLAPFLALFYCLFWKRLIFDGKAGVYYSLQRFVAELTLSLYLLDDDLRNSSDTSDDRT